MDSIDIEKFLNSVSDRIPKEYYQIVEEEIDKALKNSEVHQKLIDIAIRHYKILETDGETEEAKELSREMHIMSSNNPAFVAMLKMENKK